jgi:hypothetical protein
MAPADNGLSRTRRKQHRRRTGRPVDDRHQQIIGPGRRRRLKLTVSPAVLRPGVIGSVSAGVDTGYQIARLRPTGQCPDARSACQKLARVAGFRLRRGVVVSPDARYVETSLSGRLVMSGATAPAWAAAA